MTPQMCRLMAEYNGWMNARLYEAAAQLPEQRVHQDQGAFFGSLFNTLNHIAVADLMWLHRLVGLQGLGPVAERVASLPRPTSLREPLATTLAELALLRARVDSLITALAAQLQESHLAQTLHYTNVAGQKQAKQAGLLLMHLFNHQTHHRGQATTLLFQAGVDIGVTDLNALIPNES